MINSAVSEQLPIILEPLVALGVIEEPCEVRETYTSGYCEQLINGQHFSSNGDPEYWRIQSERAVENFIRGAQTLISTIAVHEYLQSEPTKEQVASQIEELELKIASMTTLEAQRFREGKLNDVAAGLKQKFETLNSSVSSTKLQGH